jgi:hypothetical protein
MSGVGTSRLARRYLALLGCLVLAACHGASSGGSSPQEVCAPNQQIACACVGGGAGAQVCDATGQGYGPCMGCSASDSGSESGSGSSGGGSASGAGADGGLDATVSEGGPDATNSDATNSDAAPTEATTADGAATYAFASCPDGGTTTISGTVYDPVGSNPVYNVAVYVPGVNTLPALPSGASCEPCANIYASPVVSATTDAAGNFSIPGAPYGSNVPLVIQVGKWRREYWLPTVTACTDNSAPSLLGENLQLPSNSSQGNLPDIAISTGGADSLECLPVRMGISADEYVPGASNAGHIHIFTGGAAGGASQGAVTSPASPQAYSDLWDSAADLLKNDVVIFSCEGQPTAYLAESDGPSNLLTYLDNGGRVFASHYHFAWFTETATTPANPFVALSPPLATWSNTTNTAILNDNVSFPASIETARADGGAFPEGVAFDTWLGNVDALDSNGNLDIYYARDNALVTATNTSSQAWATLDPDPSGVTATTQYFSFDTPIGRPQANQCGRAVYSDLHDTGGPGVTAQSGVTPDYEAGGGIDIVPSGCAVRALTPQEKALEFMIFDLSSCLVPVGTSPVAPALGPADASADSGNF